MRSVERLINQIRKQTENEEFSDFTGIGDQEFIQYLNDAQYNLQALIVQQHPRVFIEEVIIDAVQGQEKYALPSDCFLKNKVHNVEFSSTGDEDDYYVLEEDTLKRRNPGVSGSPAKYIRLSGQVLLAPAPQSTGKIRINYVRRLKELDKKAAKVGSDTVIDSSNSFTIPLTSDSTISTNLDSLNEHDFICVVDKEGNTLVKNIEITDVDTSLITCTAHTIESGEVSTIPEGSIIVGGKDTTTHSELDISVERYLISYCAWKILKRDSSVDSMEAIQELQAMAQEIVKSYAMVSDDVQYIPQLNSWEDWSN
jgi:hypothetical protein